MRIIVTVLCLVLCNKATVSVGQTGFEREVVALFPLLNLEAMDSVHRMALNDTIDKRVYNKYLKNKVEKGPIYVQNGKKEQDRDYYGLIPVVTSSIAQYGTDGKRTGDLLFRSKAYPIGRIHLQGGYYSLIVKVSALVSTYYDVHNFDKDGRLMSILPLYYFEHRGGKPESMVSLHIKSLIARDGRIHWWENYPNRIRERIYVLNKDGFFEIIKEKTTGELMD